MLTPKLSVIVPVYNASTTINVCIESLLNQTVDKNDYEIIVVDDGSTDDTAKIIISIPGVTLIKQRNQGPAVARNKGVEHAKGEIILFTDSDCVPKANWIEEMVRPFREDNEVVGVKGTYKTKQKQIISRFVQLEYEDKYDVMKRYKYIDFVDTYSAAFKKEIFLDNRGYDANFPVACAEDIDLSYRLSLKGYKMVFNPEAMVYHTHPDTFIDYMKKKYKFAYWRVLALRKNRNKVFKDSHTPQLMKFQILLVFFLFILSTFSIFSSVSLKIWGYLILVYLFTTTPFVIKAIKKDVLVCLISPLIMFLRSIVQCFGLTAAVIGQR